MSLEFYRNIPNIKKFRSISNEKFYQNVPSDWSIALTDVVNSTQAIEEGRYKDVNIAGGLAAIALANEYKNMEHPFVFGGDGVTFLVPPHFIESVRSILADTRNKIRTLYNINLRVALIPISELNNQGHETRVAKFFVSDKYSQAILMGKGFQEAERLLKVPDSPYIIPEDFAITKEADFTGFTCRWQDIPSHLGETISLIIQFPENSSADLIEATLNDLESVLGTEEQYHPLNEAQFELTKNKKYLYNEAKARSNSTGGFAFKMAMLYINITQFIARMAIKHRLPIRIKSTSLKDLPKYNVLSSDFRKYDGSLKMVVATTTENRKKMIQKLEALVQTKKIRFGYHIADRALLTCILQSESMGEVHFVDTADGGYAMAAKMLKAY